MRNRAGASDAVFQMPPERPLRFTQLLARFFVECLIQVLTAFKPMLELGHESDTTTNERRNNEKGNLDRDEG